MWLGSLKDQFFLAVSKLPLRDSFGYSTVIKITASDQWKLVRKLKLPVKLFQNLQKKKKKKKKKTIKKL